MPRRLLNAVGFFCAWLLVGMLVARSPSSDAIAPAGAHPFYAGGWFLLPSMPVVIGMVACVLFWYAFLKPASSDRLLFLAAMGATATVFFSGVDTLISKAIFHHLYSDSMVMAAVVFYGTCARISQGRWRTLALLALSYCCVVDYFFGFQGILSVVGGALFAGVIMEIGLYVAERAGVDFVDALEPVKLSR